MQPAIRRFDETNIFLVAGRKPDRSEKFTRPDHQGLACLLLDFDRRHGAMSERFEHSSDHQWICSMQRGQQMLAIPGVQRMKLRSCRQEDLKAVLGMLLEQLLPDHPERGLPDRGHACIASARISAQIDLGPSGQCAGEKIVAQLAINPLVETEVGHDYAAFAVVRRQLGVI